MADWSRRTSNIFYLGWLARVGDGELADADLEPPLPPGLQSLTPAQQALVEFLEIDPDWLATAASASPAADATTEANDALDAWLAEQTPETMRASLRLLLSGRSQEAERSLRQRFLAWQRGQRAPTASPSRRSVAAIDAGREAAAARRLNHEATQRAAAESQRQTERANRLKRLAENTEAIWISIDKTLQRGSGAAYGQALLLVSELAEALAAEGREADFRQGLVKCLSAHGKRAAWVSRLTKAGLLRQ